MFPSRHQSLSLSYQKVINHKYEIGFCSRTGAEDPVAVTLSCLVCFLLEEHLPVGSSILLSVSCWFRPGHSSKEDCTLFLQLFQGLVFRPGTQVASG